MNKHIKCALKVIASIFLLPIFVVFIILCAFLFFFQFLVLGPLYLSGCFPNLDPMWPMDMLANVLDTWMDL